MNLATQLIDRNAHVSPRNVAIFGSTASVSYEQLADSTNRAGNVLRGAGCRPGDRVLVAAGESAETAAAVMAAVKVGAIAVPVPPAGTVESYQYYLRDTDASLALVDEWSAEPVDRARYGDQTQMLVISGKNSREWRERVEGASSELQAQPVSGSAPAFLLYTSGSTGTQKPALHSHEAVLAATRHVGQSTFGMRDGDRVLSTARLFFSFGFGFGLCMPLAAGAASIMVPAKDLRELAKLIGMHRPTILCSVPSMLEVLIRAAGTWLDLDLSSLRFIASAGEPLPVSIFDAYRDRFDVEVVDGIGSTELLTHFISNRPGRARRGSCGRPVPGCTVRLLDEEGNPVPEGAIGNLEVRSESALLRYWGRPEATARVKANGAVATGDKMYRDAEGFYYHAGRADDMVKVSGLWVSPAEVENVLRGHPAVDRCAVTAREDGRGRRRLVAYLVPTVPDSTAQLDLYKYAGERLPDHMIPSAFVTLSELPLTANGKLRRAALPDPDWKRQ